MCCDRHGTCRTDNVSRMISPELIQSSLEASVLVHRIKSILEQEGFGNDWDSEHYCYLTDSLPNSSFLPIHRIIYLVLSWADSAPLWLGPSPHCWSQRFLTRLIYTHFEGEQYFEPSSDYDDYPLREFYWSS
jgi:hypothetical protein